MVNKNELQKKEQIVRDRLSSLANKKGETAERSRLNKELDNCLKEQKIAQALSRLEDGMIVTGKHRPNSVGVIRGFQEYAGNIRSVWVSWDKRDVWMPEDPTLLEESF